MGVGAYESVLAAIAALPDPPDVGFDSELLAKEMGYLEIIATLEAIRRDNIRLPVNRLSYLTQRLINGI